VYGADAGFVVFFAPESALDAAWKNFAEHHLDPSQPTRYLHSFTSLSKKDGPTENFLAVARHWRSKGGQVVFGGGPGDVALLDPAWGEGFSVLAGAPMLVSGGLMQLSTLVIGGDAGMLYRL
jgi:ADP-heptose:LPS heptosyltransferase